MAVIVALPTAGALDAYVAAEFRAQMARLHVTNRQVGRVIGQGDSATSRRLNGKQPMTIEEVAAIAQLLDMDIGQLLHGYPPGSPDPEAAIGVAKPAWGPRESTIGASTDRYPSDSRHPALVKAA